MIEHCESSSRTIKEGAVEPTQTDIMARHTRDTPERFEFAIALYAQCKCSDLVNQYAQGA